MEGQRINGARGFWFFRPSYEVGRITGERGTQFLVGGNLHTRSIMEQNTVRLAKKIGGGGDTVSGFAQRKIAGIRAPSDAHCGRLLCKPNPLLAQQIGGAVAAHFGSQNTTNCVASSRGCGEQLHGWDRVCPCTSAVPLAHWHIFFFERHAGKQQDAARRPASASGGEYGDAVCGGARPASV